MTKSNKPKTFFEQVPLEIVKKIAEEDTANDVTNKADPSVEGPAKKRAAFRHRRPAKRNAL